MAKKHADVCIHLTVEFDGDGLDDLQDLAIEAACDALSIAAYDVDGIEVVGAIRDTEFPSQAGGDRHGE
ncbi:hypothetical protein BR10RB9215_C20466 [Brucella sp. 10RB9215]|uniref:hypothetical protein n=1 Tax=Brucella sp. 10RB9215 TaxID=1149953 RepID=UPI000909E243|nr:hypothetical protein [Brucella sp. 10RB9215]SBW15800.1 hypothetical protein BR10RB9215_C20466 [Brucella sp. 10RB9215]